MPPGALPYRPPWSTAGGGAGRHPLRSERVRGGSAPRRPSGVCRCRVSKTGISSARAVGARDTPSPCRLARPLRRHHLATVPRDSLIWRATSAWGSPAATLRTSNSHPAGVKRTSACDIEPPVLVGRNTTTLAQEVHPITLLPTSVSSTPSSGWDLLAVYFRWRHLGKSLLRALKCLRRCGHIVLK